MSEPPYAGEPEATTPPVLDYVAAGVGTAAVAEPRISKAEWMLLVATVVWGTSFALAKGAGEAINAAAGLGQHALGPVAVLALRFTLGSLAWMALLPRRSLTGWNRTNVFYGVVLGVLLSLGLVLQHIALDRTIEAVAAFLTSLTVVFVPLILAIVFRHRLPPAAWVGVVVAVPGVWLMSDAATLSLGLGEWLGIAASFVFAWHLTAMNVFSRRDTPWRMALAQFAVVALTCWLGVLVLAREANGFDWHVFATTDVWLNITLLVLAPTLFSFGIVNVYQPHVMPVRAVLIYLLEPIFAAGFAWMWYGRSMTSGMIAGGALILVANAIVELWPRKSVVRGQ